MEHANGFSHLFLFQCFRHIKMIQQQAIQNLYAARIAIDGIYDWFRQIVGLFSINKELQRKNSSYQTIIMFRLSYMSCEWESEQNKKRGKGGGEDSKRGRDIEKR